MQLKNQGHSVFCEERLQNLITERFRDQVPRCLVMVVLFVVELGVEPSDQG